MDIFRAYRLTVTGEEVGTIKRKSQVSVEVEPTQHMLRASIDWCGSNILYVDLSEGEAVDVEVFNPNGPFRGQGVMVRAPGDYLQLRLREDGPGAGAGHETP
ncbi:MULTISPECIES: hypothetical protein [unclassified Roseovarius]|uniref:hypothetical protein n=1 Tax=unclassified Roseovarius TaxID=2614913 RepID=UPI00273E7E47|nr:hypothetical protein [Roseovarius sp. MMSF_3350]